MSTKYNCPCKRDCPRRSPECHSTCENYAAYEERKNAEYEKRRALSDEADTRITIERRRYKKGCYLG